VVVTLFGMDIGIGGFENGDEDEVETG